ncbi:MAG TPA: DUF177 domain-containing protein [Hyphomicrobium sp.]|nr:DUF177 domain-containing protein [Hyphomicrobium sp.]
MTTPALDWSYRTTEIPEAGLRENRDATAEERAALAAELEILSCEKLTAVFSIRATGKGHYRLAGELKGRVTQPCVVTLEPVSEAVEGNFDVEYWPPASMPETGEEEMEALSAAEIEPIEHGRIDAGRIVFETLVASLNPYPRKPGAEFEESESEPPSAGGTSAFEALKKLKEGR